jgi:cellulose synthase operon protein C
MILKFPDLNKLHLALVSGAIPPAMSQAAAVAGFDDQNQCLVESGGTLPRDKQAELKKLGVLFPRSSPTPLETEVSCWAEILPLEHDRTPVERLDSTPVLFDLISGEDLAQLAIEMLRLGNDRQGYRWLEDAGGQQASVRALLRVVGPPYYTLLRALDRIGGTKAPVAYLERQPRVWVEVGYSHPLLNLVKPPAGKILLLRPPRQWSLLDDSPFRDVYELTEFAVPDGPTRWKQSTKEAKRLKVTPSLRSGGAPEGAELWVLRDDPIAELNRFVQNADDQLLQRLAFAVGDKGADKTIVVRVRQSKQQPPVLVFEKAIGYKPYLKLANLFLPVGSRLHPPLRRDQVRKLLAEDTSQVVWLHPGEKNTFTPESMPEDSFRPLWDWIDYVLDHEAEPLAAWVQASQFDFEPFICDEDPAKPRKPPGEGKTTRGRDRAGQREGAGAEVNFSLPEELGPEEVAALDPFGTVAKVEPSEVQKQLRAMEETFLSLEGGLDMPDRQRLWPELAMLNAQLGGIDDASVCWMNSLWERDGPAVRTWAWAWFRAEASVVPAKGDGTRAKPRAWVAAIAGDNAKTREIPADDLDRLLNLAEPATADLRALAAYVTWAALEDAPPASLANRLGPVSRFLETHERLLPVRAVWLAWSHLTRLSSGDVLALARARDRLLERLFHNGLRPEQDLPSFLRFAGQPTSQRFRAVRQWMVDLAKLAQEWHKDSGGVAPATSQTGAYVDLTFAFGLARLGESDAAREVLQRAKATLSVKDDAHVFLYNAYEFRVRQALEGKPHTGLLSADQVEYLDHMDRLTRYVVDRRRKFSRILEPDQQINPYRPWNAKISEFEKEIGALTDLTDRNEITTRIEKLLRETPKGAKGAEHRAKVVRAGLEAAPRVGEDFARRMLDQAIPAYDALPEAKEQSQLLDQANFLEKALFLAGHFGRIESVHLLVTRFQRMLQSQKGPQVLQVLDKLAAQCFRGLRKLGMRDEIDQLLKLMADLILEGQDVKAIDFRKREQGRDALRALLQVAAGWYYFGRDSQAEPILQAARATLMANDLQPRDQTQLACVYAAAVGQAPVEIAQKRLEEIFRQLKMIKDSYTTSTHFSGSQLDVVEAVVLAVVSDDFTMGTQARRWLDDDEFLVRRRIHRDMDQAMIHTGEKGHR